MRMGVKICIYGQGNGILWKLLKKRGEYYNFNTRNASLTKRIQSCRPRIAEHINVQRYIILNVCIVLFGSSECKLRKYFVWNNNYFEATAQ